MYPRPRIDDSESALQGLKYFKTLDIHAGYWQVTIAAEDRHKTAFTYEFDLYKFNVMAFGLCNAPATFQRLMDAVLSSLKWNILLVYNDDIIMFSRTFEDHLRDVECVFDRLRDTNLRLKASKCYWRFRGHVNSLYVLYSVTSLWLKPIILV